MVILYLYAEIMGYQVPIFEYYVKSTGAEVHIIHWDHKKKTEYEVPSIEGVKFYKRSQFSWGKLKNFVQNLNPDIIYVSGWMDKGYLNAIMFMRKKNVPVVSGFDDIWFNTFRQRVASIFFPYFKNIFFSHAWVAGPYQYEFAKKIGFKNSEIIYNCLSADNSLFNMVYENTIRDKKGSYPHKFLYVGRFENVKGLDILIAAWENIKKRDLSRDWELTLIGNGSMKEYLASVKDIKCIDFMQPEDLAIELGKYGCFVLPSRFEPWALVLHEFALAGYPIICSDICGAAPVFLINRINGYTFKNEDVADLEKQILKIVNSSDDELYDLAVNSHLLGQRITTELCAASFLSIVSN